jgi:hypothetical protein
VAVTKKPNSTYRRSSLFFSLSNLIITMAKTPSKQTAAASKAPVKKAGKAAGGKKKKRTESYSSYIYKVLKQVSFRRRPSKECWLREVLTRFVTSNKSVCSL